MGSQRRNQRNEFFSRWLCLRFGIHRILESKSDSAVEKILHGCLREKMQPNLASYGFLNYFFVTPELGFGQFSLLGKGRFAGISDVGGNFCTVPGAPGTTKNSVYPLYSGTFR